MIRIAVLSGLLWGLSGAMALAGHDTVLSQLTFGTRLVVHQTEILLMVAVVALLMSFWDRRAMLRGALVFMAGVAAGFPVLFQFQIDMLWVALTLSALIGASVALHLFPPKRFWTGFLFLAGLCQPHLVFYGAVFAQTTPALLAGFVGAIATILAFCLGLCALAQTQAHRQWVSVLLRVMGSWAVAAAVIIAAFYFQNAD